MSNSEQVGQEIAELENQLQQAIQSFAILSNEKNVLQRQILEIRIKIKDLDIPLEKAKINKEKIMSDLRVKRAEFWALKGEYR
jgi:chromosome segregation ATPase